MRFLSNLIWGMRSLSGEVRSIQRKFFVHAQTPPEKGARWMYGSYALACVWFGTCAFLVLYLSSLYSLMSSGPDSRPDHYLTCNGSTGGVPDADHIFSGRSLTRNTWKLTNNGCETVVHRTKLMTFIFWGITPVTSTKMFLKRSKNVLSVARALHFRFTWYLSVN